MGKRAQIAESFRQMMRDEGVVFFTAKVQSIEQTTCTIEYKGLSLSDVRLKPTNIESEDKSTLLITPAVGSYVLVMSLSGELSNLQVVASDAVESVELTVGETAVKIDADGIVLNSGELGGLVKLKPLVAKINALESQINTLKEIVKSWTPSPNDGGAALKVLVAAWAEQPVVQTKRGEIENEKVKQ